MDFLTLQDITPDSVIFGQWGFVKINITLIFTWITMGLLVIFSVAATRKIISEARISRWQNLMEVLLEGISNQIREVSQQDPERYLPFIGTLFIFIVISNILSVIPGFVPPTSSLSTTAALAICVFAAVPVYGIKTLGLKGYLKLYVTPSPFMLPFNIIGELSRTLALAVRLFGNVMSGGKIVAILLAVAPILFPVFINALGLLTGIVQAYIFAILAMVYIASATRVQQQKEERVLQAGSAEDSADENQPEKGD